MATVFLARLSGVGGFQRFVAIKRLHPHLAREPEFIEMFLEEARLAARIHHPHVVPILEIGTSDHGYYIVMEYVEGDTLGRLLARSAQTGVRLPTKVGLRVVIDMLAGLDAAHELKDDDGNPFGIVHRDISPQNVLVGVDGSARLSDFGVARATSKLSTTRTGQLKGKLAYMSPEQARGDKDIDRRADIFASGIVLWEVLACRRLFKGEGEADTLNRVLHEAIPPVRSVAAMVPAALEAVVAKALERDRSKRYATAAEFADALERASRVVGALGTHKDVATHLEAVLGTEISAQREAVRAWLARSEPSRHGVKAPARPDPGSVTRIEGRGAERTPSGPSSGPRVPSEPAPASGSSGPSSVSSVSSAIIPAPEVLAAPQAAAAAEPRRARIWPWAVVIVGAAVAGIVWMRHSRGSGVSAVATLPPPPPSAAAVAPPPPATTTMPPAASVVASAIPLAASASTDAAPSPKPPAVVANPSRPSWRNRPAPPPPRETATAAPTPTPAPAPPPAPTPTPAPVPDDISRNPYR
jgi:serine/threonine protein kinase